MARHTSFGLRRLAGAAALLVGLPTLSLASTVGTASAAVAVVTNYTGTGVDGPAEMAVGPDGAMWFTNLDNDSIGRITTAGAITNFTHASLNLPYGITAGPDGAMWFTNLDGNSIGRITTAGAITSYSDAGIVQPRDITVGPDGALWFTNDANGGSIGRITTAGAITHFGNGVLDGTHGIAAGPDGALWFTDWSNSTLGRITTTGTITPFTHPGLDLPFWIVAGSDGAMWFTNQGSSKSIGRITMTGTVTIFPDSRIDTATGLAAGPDGNLWFTNFGYGGHDSIGRITTAGTVAIYTHPTIDGPNGIVSGPDGNLWFTNYLNDSIGRITPGEPPAVIVPGAASVVEGDSGTIDLHVPVTLPNPSILTVTADWTTSVFAGGPSCQADPTTDYTPASGTVTFAPNDTAETVTIPVNGDELVEPNECIIVSFTNATNAKIGGFYGLGVGTITNDDPPKVVPGGASVGEGDSGTTNLVVPVTLSKASTQTVTAQWTTFVNPGNPACQADSTTDYTAVSGTVTFAPSDTAETVTIAVNGDELVEPNECILVSFHSPTNAIIGGFYGLGVGTITNDD